MSPNPRVLTETAPTAAEMESGLTVPGAETQEASSLRIEMATPTQNGSRPRAPMPPITANPSPFIDEVATMPTRDLHGYAFPGMDSIEGPKMAKMADSAPLATAATPEVEAARAEAAAAKAALAEAEAAVTSANDSKQQAEAELAQLRAQSSSEQESSAAKAEMERTLVAANAAKAQAEEAKEKAEQDKAAAEAELAQLRAQSQDLKSRTSSEVAAAQAEADRALNAAAEAKAKAQTEIAQADAEAQDAKARATAAVQGAKAQADAEAAAAVQRANEVKAQAEADIAAAEAEATAAKERIRAELEETESKPKKVKAVRASQDASPQALIETVPAGAPATGAASADEPVLTEWLPVDESFYTPPTGPYRIGSGDVLEFKVFSDPLLDREVTVRYDGHVSLPLVPDMQVEDLTREEAEAQIRKAYGSVFRTPQLSLLVKQTASKTFGVIGDIETPGIYPYLRPTSLIEAVSLAGGLRRRNSSSSTGGFVGVTGQLTKAFVIRHREGERLVVQFDLRQLGNPGAHSADAPIYPGDLLYVPEGVNLVYLLGESANPVIVELTEGMTLLQMLSLSGGFNASTARLRNVVVMRQLDSENTRIMNVNVREILRTGQDIKLSPGDVIYIPQKWTVRLSEFVGRFTGSVSPVLDMYTSAVDAYFAVDSARAGLETEEVSRTLKRLADIEQFGSSTQNIFDLFGTP